MFVDDTNISTQGKTDNEIQERLNTDLENVHQWLNSIKLTLNKKKTECMSVGAQQRISNILTDPIVKLGDSTIKRVNVGYPLAIRYLTLVKYLFNEQYVM
jgi:hypothetical protein